jgi:3' exoribonuclease, RNase T-like/Prokaryotic homologs of the JAB domain
MIEAGVVIDRDGRVLHWHLPPGRTCASIPDTRELWDVFWEHRHELLGFMHSHPGGGSPPAPSHEDLTTFAAVEAGLGRRLDWWICNRTATVGIHWTGPGRLDYQVDLVGSSVFSAELLARSEAEDVDMSEIYISTDIETDGPIPGPNSMLSFGSVAFNDRGEEIGSFTANLWELTDARPDPDTQAWWKTQPEAWQAARTNPEAAADVMPRYVAWIKTLPGKPVFVAYPAGFDFLFVYWYLIRFTGGSPFSFSAVDIKTYAMALLDCGYRDATKKNWPADWSRDTGPHTHCALDDAREQGLSFMRMLQDRHRLLEEPAAHARHP